jgi:hypothetical protein
LTGTGIGPHGAIVVRCRNIRGIVDIITCPY